MAFSYPSSPMKHKKSLYIISWALSCFIDSEVPFTHAADLRLSVKNQNNKAAFHSLLSLVTSFHQRKFALISCSNLGVFSLDASSFLSFTRRYRAVCAWGELSLSSSIGSHRSPNFHNFERSFLHEHCSYKGFLQNINGVSPPRKKNIIDLFTPE